MRVAERMPKADIGMMSEKPVTRKAEAVVRLVTSIALEARR